MGNYHNNVGASEEAQGQRPSYFSVVPAEVLITDSPKVVIDKRMSKSTSTTAIKTPVHKSLLRRVKELVIPAMTMKAKVSDKPAVEEVKVTKTKVIAKPKKPKVDIQKTTIPWVVTKPTQPPKKDKVEVKIVRTPPREKQSEVKIILPPNIPKSEGKPDKAKSKPKKEKTTTTQTIVFKPHIQCPTPHIQQPQTLCSTLNHPNPPPVIVQAPPVNVTQDPVIKHINKPATFPTSVPPPPVQVITVPQPAFTTESAKPTKKKRRNKVTKRADKLESSSSEDIHEAIWQELKSLSKKINKKHSKASHGSSGDNQYLNQTFPLVAPQPQYIGERTPAMATRGQHRGYPGIGRQPINREKASESFSTEVIHQKVKPPREFRNKKVKTGVGKAKKGKIKKKGDQRVGKMYPISERGLFERLLNVGHPEPDKMPDQRARSNDLVEGDNPAPPWGDDTNNKKDTGEQNDNSAT